MGEDWGNGGTAIVDGTSYGYISTGWYAGGWAKAVATPTLVFGAGPHTVQFIGFEDCCDGGGPVQYIAPNKGGDWASVDNTFSLGPC